MNHFPLPEIFSSLAFQTLCSPVFFLYYSGHVLCLLSSSVLLCLALGCWFSQCSAHAIKSLSPVIHSGSLDCVPRTPKSYLDFSFFY